MATQQDKDGHRRFIELAQSIGDEATLNRIRHGLHPYRNEYINEADWPMPERSAA